MCWISILYCHQHVISSNKIRPSSYMVASLYHVVHIAGRGITLSPTKNQSCSCLCTYAPRYIFYICQNISPVCLANLIFGTLYLRTFLSRICLRWPHERSVIIIDKSRYITPTIAHRSRRVHFTAQYMKMTRSCVLSTIHNRHFTFYNNYTIYLIIE